MKKILLALMLMHVAFSHAGTFECKVEKKYSADLSVIQTKQEVEKSNFNIKVQEAKDTTVKRCSFALSQNAVTCDTYSADRIEFTNTQFVKIKKFYVTNSQYDIQIFEDLSFIENNGRGSIAYGKCKSGL
jgi:hypothetical protein